MQPISIYIHIPFCQKRCGYCDFTTFAGMETYLPAYIDALMREVELIGRGAAEPVPVHTLFLGGGTPSLLSAGQVERIIKAICKHFTLLPEAEISLEANPGTVNLQKLSGYRKAGVNRISFGVQSAIPEELAVLQRIHTADEARQAVEMARLAGFENINLDLIFAIPNQTMETWQESLTFALSTGVEHLSLYNLTIEENTPLYEQVKRGEIEPIDPDLAADMYEFAVDSLLEKGFLHYEISNWAANRNGLWQMCRHNLQYWRNLPYLGFGVGSHGFFENQRLENSPSISEYLARIGKGGCEYPKSPANVASTVIDQQEQMKDTMMLGLRLLDEGVDPQAFHKRFGLALEDVFSTELLELTSLGLLEKHKPYHLTRRGMMVGNQVFMRFVGD